MGVLGRLKHLFICVFFFHLAAGMVIPAIIDVTMAALCPGRDECSLAIYLSGLLQAVTGLGAVFVTPLVGNLSDKHGRKALLAVPMAAAVVPTAILACDRSTPSFYAYYVIKMFSGMLCEGSMQCLSLAYVADTVIEKRRASAFGILSGVSMAGFVSGTVAARILPVAAAFRSSATVAFAAAAYMRAFLAETDGGAAVSSGEPPSSRRAAAATSPGGEEGGGVIDPPPPSLKNTVSLLRSSSGMTMAANVAFFNGLGEAGIHASLLFFLKAKFHFDKNQFADLLLIHGIAGAFSQLLLMPIFSRLGEGRLLSLGLLAGSTHLFFYSIAWSSWVPYFACTFVLLSVFIQPCIRSIVSRKVGPSEQGMAQGCITGISSSSSILAPLIFSPLSALFLSDAAPFDFKGFSLMCCGFSTFAAFLLSLPKAEHSAFFRPS